MVPPRRALSAGQVRRPASESVCDGDAPGAVLIVSYDRTELDPRRRGFGHMNGRIYRVGNPVPGQANTWELAPGNDMAPTDPATLNADVFVVGRSLLDPTRDPDINTNPFEGGVQDIAVYTSFIYANQ